MVLMDTNILIDLWRNPKQLSSLHITPDKFAICGPVRSELLHGAKDSEINDYLKFFTGFSNLITDDYDWDGIGFIMQTLRSSGTSIPFADAVIAYTAIKYDIPLWTRDSHFTIIQAYYPELKLYEE